MRSAPATQAQETPLLRPTTDEILRSISRDFDDHIRREPGSPLAISLSLTTSNLLRHVRLRVEREEGLIGEDLEDLDAVLDEALHFMYAAGPAASQISTEITKALDTARSDAAVSARDADKRWVRLRWLLSRALDMLIEKRDAFCHRPGYNVLRDHIRAYLDRSLLREEALIAEAFMVARR
jgi:hypothetical protein